MGKRKNRNKLAIFIFIMCLLVVGVLIVYYQLMRKQQEQQRGKTPSTEMEKLIAKDLEVGYPETPSELLKLWGRINKCLYNNDDLTKDETEKLIKQLRLMYSSELLAQNEEGAQIKKMTQELEEFYDGKNKIVNYTSDSDTNVQYKTVNNKECAYLRLSCLITQAKGGYMKMYQDFILTKEDNKWKVAGFRDSKQESVTDEEAGAK